MSRAAKLKPSKRYPFVAFRPSPEIEKRLRRCSAKTGLSMSLIVFRCVQSQLAAIETKFALDTK